VLELPGGGGYGDPTTRDNSLVEQDVAREYISAEQTQRDYQNKD